MAWPLLPLALADTRCVDDPPNFVPILPGGTSHGYHTALYAIGANNTYSLPRKCSVPIEPPPAVPTSTVQRKSALLVVPPVPRLPTPKPVIVAAVPPREPEQLDVAPAEQVVVPIPRPAPAPVEAPTAPSATLPEEMPVDEAGYSEPSLMAPVMLGMGVAAVLTYTVLEAMDEKDNGKPTLLSIASEPVEALAAYDTKMLASFAAINTVADLQSDQRFSMGLSGTLYDDTPAFAAGMSLRLGSHGIFKTAFSLSGDEYLANAGVSYGW